MAASTYITGMGMVTPLGLDAVTSCAAARAGLSRAGELDYFTTWSPADGEVAPVKGHQIPQLTEGFEGNTRLTRILGGALADLIQTQPNIPWDSRELAVYLALPDRSRIWYGADIVADDEIRQTFEAAQEQIPDDNTELEDAQRILQISAKSAGISRPLPLKMVSRADNCAMAECYIQAAKDLAAGQVRHAIVAGAESLLEEATLEWLEFTGRLKSPAVPTGLAPGEAGVAFLVEAKSSDGQTLAECCGTHTANEENTLFSGKPVLGRALAALVKETCGNEQSADWFITDLNGENYRSLEWGNALVRMEFEPPDVTYPAISFGDTGVCSAGIGIATAIHGFSRGSAPADRAVILSSSSASERTALVIAQGS